MIIRFTGSEWLARYEVNRISLIYNYNSLTRTGTGAQYMVLDQQQELQHQQQPLDYLKLFSISLPRIKLES